MSGLVAKVVPLAKNSAFEVLQPLAQLCSLSPTMGIALLIPPSFLLIMVIILAVILWLFVRRPR